MAGMTSFVESKYQTVRKYVAFDSTGFAAFSKECQTLLYTETVQCYWCSCYLIITV